MGGILPQTLNEIQPGLLINLLGNVWGVVLKMTLRLDERKVCTMGLLKIMALDDVRQNPQVLNSCCLGLISLLCLTPSANGAVDEEEEDDGPAPPADGGA